MGSTERLHIRWNDFESNIKCGLSELRQEKELFDVTLACGSKQIKAHKVILSACSPFFRSIIKSVPHEHPLLYLRGVQFHHLESLLAFIYNGEVNVTQEELDSFLAVAEELKIKGLAHNEAFISSLSVPESHPPPNKRPRNEDQGISPEPSITGLCISAYSLKTHSSLVISKETSPNPSKFPPQKEQDIPIGEDDDEIEDVTIVKEEDKYVFESNNDEVGLDNQSQELENELHDVKYIEDHIDFESESEELCCDTLRDSENTSHPDLNKGGFEKQVFFKLPKLEERVQAIPGSIQGFGSKVRKKKIGQEEFNKPFSKLANTEEEYDSFGRQLVASDYKMRKEIEFQQPPQQSKKRRHISATCAVASCPSPADTSYHNFPKDSALLRNWVKACKRKDKFNPKKSRICSNHFSQDCYERDLRNELLGLPLRRLLKKGSVPSVNLYNSSISSLTIPSKRTKRSWRREIHQTIQPFLAVEHQDSSERIPQIVEIL